jgi:steroid 5-alpha reductase family enzyme
MPLSNPWILLATGAACVALIMFVLWLVGLARKNFSYVDIGWSANFAVLALLYAMLAPGFAAKKWLLAAMFCLHGTRLAWHLGRRILGHPEEGRYVQLRRDWGAGGRGSMNLKFLLFFEFQALLNVFLSLPLLIVALDADPRWYALEIAGAAVFFVALIGESSADAQLAAFKRDPANRGGVCDVGLWHYSRHPNYFFEWLIWIGYALFALGSPYGWVALASPLLMLHFLINVTGLKATEAQALRTKGERYRLYQARTSAFIPWFPRHPADKAPP